MSRDRAQVAVALHPRSDEMADHGSIILVYDLTSSGVDPLVVDRTTDGHVFRFVEGLDWSDDGAELAAQVRTGGYQLLVIDPHAGQITAQVDLGGASCTNFGLLPVDHPLAPALQCSQHFVDLPEGDLVARTPGEGDPSDTDLPEVKSVIPYDGALIATSASGAINARLGTVATVDLEPGGTITAANPIDWLMFDGDEMLITVGAEEQRSWWRAPRRQRPGGQLTWIDVNTKRVVATVSTGWRPRFVATLDDGWLATIDDNGTVRALRQLASDPP